MEDNSREIIQSACRSIGSIKDNEFDVRFNPDLFQPHVTLSQTVRIETKTKDLNDLGFF